MSDMISRSALDAEMQKAQESLESNSDHAWEMNRGQHKGLAWARRLCADAHAVDAAPVVHARWVHEQRYGDSGGWVWRCTACRREAFSPIISALKYCHACGAKMDGGA